MRHPSILFPLSIFFPSSSCPLTESFILHAEESRDAVEGKVTKIRFIQLLMCEIEVSLAYNLQKVNKKYSSLLILCFKAIAVM